MGRRSQMWLFLNAPGPNRGFGARASIARAQRVASAHSSGVIGGWGMVTR